MDNKLKYSLKLEDKANFNFLSDKGTIGHKGIQVLGNNEYIFSFENNVIVKSSHNKTTKSNMFYSNTKMTDTGTNPQGVRIIGLGDPLAFDFIQK